MKAEISKGIGVLLMGCLLSACATHLRPAPEAREVVAGPGVGAEESAKDVHVEVRVQAWGWSPSRLDRHMTPALVKIENESDHPLRIRYEDFVLVDASERRYAALPPFDIDEEVNEPIRPAYGYHGFRVAPHLGYYYPYGPAYRGAFAYPGVYYGDYYTVMEDIQLPTTDMLSHALPEGVVEPDGRVAGFLYFEKVEEPEAESAKVYFRFSLVDAKSGERFGSIEIPFQVD